MENTPLALLALGLTRKISEVCRSDGLGKQVFLMKDGQIRVEEEYFCPSFEVPVLRYRVLKSLEEVKQDLKNTFFK